MTRNAEKISAHDITVILPVQNGRLAIGLADNGAVVKRLKPKTATLVVAVVMKTNLLKQKAQTTHAQKATSNTA
jgi:hypothetical protein